MKYIPYILVSFVIICLIYKLSSKETYENTHSDYTCLAHEPETYENTHSVYRCVTHELNDFEKAIRYMNTFGDGTDNMFDVVLNVIYNQGAYGSLIDCLLPIISNRYPDNKTMYKNIVSGLNDIGPTRYTNEKGVDVNSYTDLLKCKKDVPPTYQRYPVDVRETIDQLCARSEHVDAADVVSLSVDTHTLSQIVINIFTYIAYIKDKKYVYISADDVTSSITKAATKNNITVNNSTFLSYSNEKERNLIYAFVEDVITTLSTDLGTTFIEVTDNDIPDTLSDADKMTDNILKLDKTPISFQRCNTGDCLYKPFSVYPPYMDVNTDNTVEHFQTEQTSICTNTATTNKGIVYYHMYTPFDLCGPKATDAQNDICNDINTKRTSKYDTLDINVPGSDIIIFSALVSGIFLGWMIKKGYPNIKYNKDYIYGTQIGQLFQEAGLPAKGQNCTSDTNKYCIHKDAAYRTSLLNAGQGGPFQINDWDAFNPDMRNGISVYNYVALQKSMSANTVAGTSGDDRVNENLDNDICNQKMSSNEPPLTLSNLITSIKLHTSVNPFIMENIYLSPVICAYWHFTSIRAYMTIVTSKQTSGTVPEGSKCDGSLKCEDDLVCTYYFKDAAAVPAGDCDWKFPTQRPQNGCCTKKPT